MIEKVRKPSISLCYTPSLDSYIIYCYKTVSMEATSVQSRFHGGQLVKKHVSLQNNSVQNTFPWSPNRYINVSWRPTRNISVSVEANSVKKTRFQGGQLGTKHISMESNSVQNTFPWSPTRYITVSMEAISVQNTLLWIPTWYKFVYMEANSVQITFPLRPIR
jgi:hypothetical protein